MFGDIQKKLAEVESELSFQDELRETLRVGFDTIISLLEDIKGNKEQIRLDAREAAEFLNVSIAHFKSNIGKKIPNRVRRGNWFEYPMAELMIYSRGRYRNKTDIPLMDVMKHLQQDETYKRKRRGKILDRTDKSDPNLSGFN